MFQIEILVEIMNDRLENNGRARVRVILAWRRWMLGIGSSGGMVGAGYGDVGGAGERVMALHFAAHSSLR